MVTNKLLKLNITACVLHFTILISIVVWTTLKYKPNEKNYISTGLYSIRNDSDTNNTNQIKNSIMLQHSDWFMFILIYVFLLITALSHLFYCIMKKWYIGMIDDKNNYARWIEYSITATLMIMLIMFTSGIKDFDVFVSVSVCTFCLMLLGQVIEVMISDNRIKDAILLTGIAWSLFALIWYNISSTFIHIFQNNAEIPNFVTTVYAMMFVMYSSFGFVQIYQLIYPQTNYENIEISYVILSFISKALLVMLLTSGLIART